MKVNEIFRSIQGENNWTVEEDTFFVIHSSRREDD